MISDLSIFENRKCVDGRTGECLGIVLKTELFTHVGNPKGNKSYLWTIREGVSELRSFLGDEIQEVEISPEPLEMRDLIFNASVLFVRWQRLADANSDAATVAWNERRDYLHQLARIIEVNDLKTDFNLEFLMTSLACISFY